MLRRKKSVSGKGFAIGDFFKVVPERGKEVGQDFLSVILADELISLIHKPGDAQEGADDEPDAGGVIFQERPEPLREENNFSIVRGEVGERGERLFFFFSDNSGVAAVFTGVLVAFGGASFPPAKLRTSPLFHN